MAAWTEQTEGVYRFCSAQDDLCIKHWRLRFGKTKRFYMKNQLSHISIICMCRDKVF